MTTLYLVAICAAVNASLFWYSAIEQRRNATMQFGCLIFGILLVFINLFGHSS